MIITPSKNAKVIPTLVEFAYAEYGSALEMLAAAKAVKSPRLKVGYINHALDEYRHANLIFSIVDIQLQLGVGQYNKSFKFCPQHVVTKGYVDKRGFLVEKLKTKAFVEFVYSNEFLAKEAFLSLKKRIQDTPTRALIDEIMQDEEQHADESMLTLEEIMADEDRHWGYAKKYHQAVFPNSNLKIAFYRERFKNRMRLLYLKNVRLLSFVFSPLIKIVIVLFGGVVSWITIKEHLNQNLMDGDPRSII
jgi:hypothetical protein